MERVKNWRLIVFILVDICILYLSYLASASFLAFRVDMNSLGWSLIVITFIHLFMYYIFGLYKSLWLYASMDEFLLSLGACILAGALSLIYMLLIHMAVPLIVSLLSIVFNTLGITTLRFSFRIIRRLFRRFGIRDRNSFRRVLVIGAGSAGAMIINEMKNHPNLKYLPVGLIDDNRQKIGKSISGIRVLGGREKIASVVREKKVDEIIIAIPTLYGKSKAELIQFCKGTGCKTRILPALYELISGEKTIRQLRDVNAEDLLGREPITLDSFGIYDYIKGKIVMVTGGGGSIGSELCRQIMKFFPKELIILDCYENNAYELYNELLYNRSTTLIKVIIASITDRKMMEKVFKQQKPDVVFHAAAHKHVPLMEDNPAESIKNNVFGTMNIAECAIQAGTKKFVMISSDKAVNPTNIMGASKRICEMIIQESNMYSSTEFVAVRFGNVLGSNGSVIPLFQKQIAMGRPLTVTDKRVTRYFMTVQEAVQLVLQAGTYAKGGEIFVLDMGKPVKIYDLAADLIKLSGLELNRDVEIEIIGLRPGEKLYEELLMAEEGLEKTQHDKIYIAKPLPINAKVFQKNLTMLRDVAEDGDEEELYQKIEEIVPTYQRYRKTTDGKTDTCGGNYASETN